MNSRRRAITREPKLALALIDPTSPIVKLVDEVTVLLEKNAPPSPMIVALTRSYIKAACPQYLACQEDDEPFYSDQHGIMCASGRDGNKLFRGHYCKKPCKVGSPDDFQPVRILQEIQPMPSQPSPAAFEDEEEIEYFPISDSPSTNPVVKLARSSIHPKIQPTQ